MTKQQNTRVDTYSWMLALTAQRRVRNKNEYLYQTEFAPNVFDI